MYQNHVLLPQSSSPRVENSIDYWLRDPKRIDQVQRGEIEVPWVLFLGLCLDFHYFSTGVVFPKFGFDFSRGAVA